MSHSQAPLIPTGEDVGRMMPIAGARTVKAQDELAAPGLDCPPRRQNPASYDGEEAG